MASTPDDEATEDQAEIGRRLRGLRILARLDTPEALEATTGGKLKVPTIKRIEAGTRLMTLPERQLVAGLTGFPVGWFTAPRHLLGAATTDEDLDLPDAIDAQSDVIRDLGDAINGVRSDVARLVALAATDVAQNAAGGAAGSQRRAGRRRAQSGARPAGLPQGDGPDGP